MEKFNLHTFENEEIKLHKEQQLLLLERYKVTREAYEFHHKKYMEEPTKDNHYKALKAFEFMTHDLNNIKLHQIREMEERLRVASDMINSNERV